MTPEKFEEICHVLETTACGTDKACKNAGVSPTHFRECAQSSPELEARYVRAKSTQVDTIVDEMSELEDEMMETLKELDVNDSKATNAYIQAYRIKMDNRKWIASKLKPKKYGERLDLTSDGKALPTSVSVIPMSKSQDVE
jgi:DNA-binding ferritin-like protein